MFKICQIVLLTFFVLIFCSCNGQLDTNDICKQKFKEARDLVYTNPNAIRESALDSALNLANECLKCDSIKKAVVDFKITLLTFMKKYSEGISFIDSLKENDFSFNYKKRLMSDNLQALSYALWSPAKKIFLLNNWQRLLLKDEYKNVIINSLSI